MRTQCNHYLNAGEFKAYEELGVEQYLYLATLDYKTCRRCQPLDGRIFNTKDRREGVNAPTIHPHCRCTTTVPVEFARRWARDPITGKGVKIPNTTYSEWVESMSEEQKAAFDKNVKMYKNRSSDKKQYERYKERLGKENVPETLELFQEKKYNGSGDHKALERSYRTIGEIEGKSQWSDTFRQKAIDAYWEFKQNGIEMSAHAVGRFLDRCEGMFTLNDIVMQAKRRFNYIQPDGRYVKFYNGIAIIYNSSGTEVVSLVMRNTIKKDWSELHD